ncbi:hypothetical protein SprV_0501775000 [Sparganum proliferum]
MDTLKIFLKRLQINPVNWEDPTRDRPTWWRAVKTGAAIYEVNRITAVKAKRKARKSQLPPPRNANAQPPRPAHDASRRSEHQSASFDISIPPAAPGRHQLLSPRPTLSHPPRRHLTLTVLLNSHCHPPPPPHHPLRRLLHPPPLSSILTHRQTSASTSPTPAMCTWSMHILIATVPSPHTSAWSVTCESSAPRLTNQCLEHPYILAASSSTVHTAPAHSLTAWPSRPHAHSRERKSPQPRNTQHIYRAYFKSHIVAHRAHHQ